MTSRLAGPGRSWAGIGVQSARTLAATRIIRPCSPAALVRATAALVRWGHGPAGGYAALAARMPGAVAIIDDAGSLTFAELHAESNALARGLAALGVRAGDSVALMCRNHRWFVEATIAIARIGANALYLNTGFAGPQAAELLERERPALLLLDQEFDGVGDHLNLTRVIVWSDDPSATTRTTVELMVACGDRSELDPPPVQGHSIILTSGTTGTPRGAVRGTGSLVDAAAILSRLPLRHGGRTYVAAPLFHAWGWAHLNLAMLLGSTVVLTRRFDPEDMLSRLERHRCDAAVVVPVMLHRVLELPATVLDHYDLDSVRVVAASGSMLPGTLATVWMDRFGDHLYNTYGSTECAWATIARPADLRRHPDTAGAPPIGTSVVVRDDAGRTVPDGVTGRLFVTNSARFDGYTDSERTVVPDGEMATGDLGRITNGLLFVEGRDDEMIVSGGENVYPVEVEECLLTHHAVSETAVVGTDDVDFGQRLIAYVVLHADAGTTAKQLRAHVRERLASHKVPRDVRIVAELPRNETGKVLKRALPSS